MPLRLTVFAWLLALPSLAFAQETFSIVAVDTNNGKIGSAGASCLDATVVADGAAIISSVIPGKGAIHTQARYRPQNQENAEQKLRAGLGADSIIQWLVANDAFNSPEFRQYGIARLTPGNKPQTAAFTGSATDSFKGHLTGSTYAIQGNILKGQVVLDTMQQAFLNTSGPLEDRLMAALKAAAIPGADRRCLTEGVSSQSAFLRVAKPGDNKDSLFVDLKVTRTPKGVEPIDSLQKLFTDTQSVSISNKIAPKVQVTQSFREPELTIQTPEDLINQHRLKLELRKLNGQLLLSRPIHQSYQQVNLSPFKQGFYIYRIRNLKGQAIKTGQVVQF